MKNKIFNIIFYIIIVILIVILICLFMNNLNSIDINSDYVLKTYYTLGNDNLDTCNGLIMYTDSRVEYNDLKDDNKLCLAYRNIEKYASDILNKTKKENYCYLDKTDNKGFILNEDNKCDVNVLSYEDINNVYTNLFNQKINDYIDFQISDNQMCYVNKDNYLCGESIIQTYTYGWSPTYYRILYKAKEKGSYLYIYDYFLLINNNKCYLTNDDSIENEKCSNKLNNKKDINNHFITKYGRKYIHTFKQNKDGNYYWISSEAK